jgi:hypothetical protein
MSAEIIVKDNAIIREQIDMQITTAKAYPRDIKKVLNQAIMLATLDEETAESCIYSLPRGKDKNTGQQQYLKGESIRLAEIMVSTWGNFQCATRIVSNDGKTITAEGAAWDLENNVKISREVQRSIVDSSGRTYRADMQVVTGNAAAAIALRNAIFSVIPKALAKKVYEAAVKFAIGDQTKLSSKVKALIQRFEKMGIGSEKIFAYFNKNNVEEVTQEEVEEMIGIGTSIKDGSLPIDKAFVLSEEDNTKARDLESKLS